MNPQIDALGAREYFHSQNRSDLFGSFATWYFGMIPNGTLPWFQSARLIQILVVVIAALMLLRFALFRNYLTTLVLIVALIFATNVNRDAFSLSFLVLGTVIVLQLRLIKSPDKSKLITLILIGFLCLAFMMRPYFAFVCIPLLNLAIGNRKWIYKAFFIVIIVLTPLGINKVISQELNFQKAFPSQQPIAQDLAYLACQSNNVNIQVKAFRVMKIVNEELSATQLCQLSSIHSGFLISGDPWKGAPPAFQLLTELNEDTFQSFQREYLKVAIARPDLFLKIKFHNFIELLFAKGQMQHLEPLNVSNNILVKSFSKLMIFLDKLGLFSVLFICLILAYLWLTSNRQLKFDKFIITLFHSAIFSLTGFSVIYVGAIGRYTYITFTLLSLCLAYFMHSLIYNQSREKNA